MVSKIIIIKLFVYFGNEIDLYLQGYLMYIKIATTQGAVDELLVQHSVGYVARPLLGHGNPGVRRPELLVVGSVSTASLISTLG